MTQRLGLLALVALATPTCLAAQDTARVVRSVRFEGNHAIDDYTLRIAIGTTQSSWFARSALVRWLGLGEKREFDPLEFRRDVLRLTLLYRQSGFLEVVVDTVVHRDRRDVSLLFQITEGRPVVVTRFDVNGLDSLSDSEKLLEDLPLRVGQPFNRFLFQASADSLIHRLRNRGYAAVEVFRNYDVDRERRQAAVTLDVAPGLRMRVGSIRVEGTSRVDTSFVRQLLTARPGDTFQERSLYLSQRKLYQTELFRFATVGIDSAGFSPDSVEVPLVVRVSEGKSHQIRSSVGFATNDCFRGGVGWTDRNLLGSGRLFDISARVSKVGVGKPFELGLERSLCASLKEDTIGSRLANYNVTGSVRQPRFFRNPDIAATYSAFAERRSEFSIYRRQEVGLGVRLVRETERRVPITLAYRLSYGATDATPETFCAFFNACTPGDASRLQQRRVLGIISLGASWPRVNNPLDPTRGHQYAFDVSHSSRYTGSEPFQTFTRLSGDASWYQSLGGGVVLSWHLRGGLIFSPEVSISGGSASFIPPEERFYAGGPNDVRGFDRNELGPVVYVLNRDTITAEVQDSLDQGLLRPRFSATGGNTLGLGQVELRLPSPFWRERLRFAVFVDAGSLFERENTTVAPATIRFTPGVGIRIATPLGPARFDLGYNPYGQQSGALYLASNGVLTRVQTSFVQPRRSRFNLHFSFGQPF